MIYLSKVNYAETTTFFLSCIYFSPYPLPGGDPGSGKGTEWIEKKATLCRIKLDGLLYFSFTAFLLFSGKV